MYCRGRTENASPFEIRCMNCGSHDVTVSSDGKYEMRISCNNCNSELRSGRYNELTYNENEGGNNAGCGLFMATIAVVAIVVFMMVFNIEFF